MIFILIDLFLLLLCLIDPAKTVLAVKDALILWFRAVVPSLLPFMILSRMLFYKGAPKKFAVWMRPLLRFLSITPEAGFAFVMSLLCGFPTGSIYVKKCDLPAYCAHLCFCAGPMFVIGTVGQVFLKSAGTGFSLWVIQLCTLLILAPFHKSMPKKKFGSQPRADKGTGDAVTESCLALLRIAGYMSLSTLIVRLLLFPLPEGILKGMLTGMVEVTGGIAILQNYPSALPLISFLLSFGGGCILMQCLSYLKYDPFRFILIRLVYGTVAMILCWIYKKTALYVPIIITVIVTGAVKSYRVLRKRYLLKSARSCSISSSSCFNCSLNSEKTSKA